MVKIIAFDLDGTLYDSHKHIDKDTIHKIIELEQKGIDEKSIASKVNSIKEQKITDIFYLPKGGRLQEEYIAVLNDVHTLPLQAFGQDIEKEKLYTLSQEGFWVFLIKLSIHFCRFHENVPR